MSIAAGEILLSKNISVAKYRMLEDARNRVAIARFVQARFTERYLQSLSADKSTKSGFAIMALSCLMIEALEAFWHGRNTTQGRGSDAFFGFFQRNGQFAIFAPLAQEFYKNIRCGLLHQAETTGGWRIRRSGALYDEQSQTINATKFLSAMESALNQYASELQHSDWDTPVWRNLRRKMGFICKNAV